MSVVCFLIFCNHLQGVPKVLLEELAVVEHKVLLEELALVCLLVVVEHLELVLEHLELAEPGDGRGGGGRGQG